MVVIERNGVALELDNESCYVEWTIVHPKHEEKLREIMVAKFSWSPDKSLCPTEELLKSEGIEFTKVKQYQGDLVVLNYSALYWRRWVDDAPPEASKDRALFNDYSWNFCPYSTELFKLNQDEVKKKVIDYENFVWRVIKFLSSKEDSLFSSEEKSFICATLMNTINESYQRFNERESDIQAIGKPTNQDGLGRRDDNKSPAGSLPNFWGIKDASHVPIRIMRRKQECINCHTPIFAHYVIASQTAVDRFYCYDCGKKYNKAEDVQRIYKKVDLKDIREYCQQMALANSSSK